MINDYNRNMGGVDLAHQRISNCMPQLRFHRTWMSLFLQCLNIVRNSSYIVYKKSTSESMRMSHKHFVLQMIATLRSRSYQGEYPPVIVIIRAPIVLKCRDPVLPDCRLHTPASKHQHVLMGSRRRCIIHKIISFMQCFKTNSKK